MIQFKTQEDADTVINFYKRALQKFPKLQNVFKLLYAKRVNSHGQVFYVWKNQKDSFSFRLLAYVITEKINHSKIPILVELRWDIKAWSEMGATYRFGDTGTFNPFTPYVYLLCD